MEILVLGGTGGLGRLVCDELGRRGVTARAFGRRDGDARDPEVVTRAAAGAKAIINCAGASVALGGRHGWRGYHAVDTRIGVAAVAAARAHDLRLVYVGVHHPGALAGCAYVDAHERVVRAMRDIDGVVVRATGFYSAFAALIALARRGLLVDVGDGHARTNPIDEHDLAAIVSEVAFGDGPREIAAGGPQVLTRAEIFAQVAARANRRVRTLRVPAWLASCGAAGLSLLHPRIGQFGRFAAGLARHDVIAPALGTTRLADYLASEADAPGRARARG